MFKRSNTRSLAELFDAWRIPVEGTDHEVTHIICEKGVPFERTFKILDLKVSGILDFAEKVGDDGCSSPYARDLLGLGCLLAQCEESAKRRKVERVFSDLVHLVTGAQHLIKKMSIKADSDGVELYETLRRWAHRTLAPWRKELLEAYIKSNSDYFTTEIGTLVTVTGGLLADEHAAMNRLMGEVLFGVDGEGFLFPKVWLENAQVSALWSQLGFTVEELGIKPNVSFTGIVREMVACTTVR